MILYSVQCIACALHWTDNNALCLTIQMMSSDDRCESPLAADGCGSSAAARLSQYSTRLQVFRVWPQPDRQPAAQDLAAAGFASTGDGDRVRCPRCQRVFRVWNPGDHPYEEHRREEPCCQSSCIVLDNDYNAASRLLNAGVDDFARLCTYTLSHVVFLHL